MLNTPRELLLAELRELYAAEFLIEDALGRLIEAANSHELKAALKEHRELTVGHARRLDAVFRDMYENPKGGHAGSLKTLLRDGEDRLGAGGDPHVLDAAIIASSRQVEHWEMGGYDTAAVFAERLGLGEVAALLRRTLEDEQTADTGLCELARTLPMKGEGHS